MNDNTNHSHLFPFARKSHEAEPLVRSIEGADAQIAPEQALILLQTLEAGVINIRQASPIEEEYHEPAA